MLFDIENKMTRYNMVVISLEGIEVFFGKTFDFRSEFEMAGGKFRVHNGLLINVHPSLRISLVGDGIKPGVYIPDLAVAIWILIGNMPRRIGPAGYAYPQTTIAEINIALYIFYDKV
jgi:hypothetical protein